MPQGISKHSPEDVINAIESNLVDFSTTLGRTDDGVVFRGSDVTWVYTGLPSLSRVLQARFSPEDAKDRVGEILAYFKQWDASVTWVVGPSSFPPRISDSLQSNGFGSPETWSGMAVDLATLPAKLDRPDSLRIRIAADESSLRTWASLMPDHNGSETEAIAEMFSPNNAGGDPRTKYYLGYLNGKPVGRCMAFTSEETVGLYWVNTLPGTANQNVAALLVHRALSDAKTAGAKIGVMAVPPAGEALCTKLGFKPYCQFHAYGWPPSPLPMPKASEMS
jgi:hypothetical protein